MSHFIKRAFKLAKKNGISIIAFEAIFRPLSMAILVMMLNGIVGKLLQHMGCSYLTAENFGEFLSSPFNALVLLAFLALLSFVCLIEMASVLFAAESSYEGKNITIMRIFLHGLRDAFSFVKSHPFSWFPYVLLTLPFLQLHFIIWEISQNKLMEYSFTYLVKLLPKSWMIGPVLVLLLVLSALACLSLPYSILEKMQLRESIGQTRKMLEKRYLKCLRGIIFMEIAILFFTALFLLTSSFVLVVVSMLFVPNANRANMVLTYSSTLKNITAVVCGSAGTILGIYGITTGYIPLRFRVHKQIAEMDAIKKKHPWIKEKRWLGRGIVFLMILAELGGNIANAYLNRGSYGSVESNFKVAAHRGGALKAPENTLSALEYAIACMADYAEIDVQETADDRLILMHDNNVKRTTGFNGKVWDLTLAQIKNLDAGVKFNKAFVGEKVPTLEEAIETARGRLLLNIEVKNNGHNANIVSRVVQCIEDENFVDQCVITSMDLDYLKKVKELNPDIKTGYIMVMAYGNVQNFDAADFLSVRYNYVTEPFVKRAHKYGKEVHAWTVNYPGDIQRMLNYDVDGIITDDPALVRGFSAGEEKLKSDFGSLMQYALR